jgi:hypothetical protein
MEKKKKGKEREREREREREMWRNTKRGRNVKETERNNNKI